MHSTKVIYRPLDHVDSRSRVFPSLPDSRATGHDSATSLVLSRTRLLSLQTADNAIPSTSSSWQPHCGQRIASVVQSAANNNRLTKPINLGCESAPPPKKMAATIHIHHRHCYYYAARIGHNHLQSHGGRMAEST